jgi:hypothetical protein
MGLAALACLVASGAACSRPGPFEVAERSFAEGRYAAAKGEFAALEGASHRWSDAGRAAYAVDRGLTLLALGDLARARVWLGEAQAIARAHPGALSDRDARRMDIAVAANALVISPR